LVIVSLLPWALDEWEVFLDNVNRKEIARKLLRFSLDPRSQDFQFIFISPQGTGDVLEEIEDEERSKVSIVEIHKDS